MAGKAHNHSASGRVETRHTALSASSLPNRGGHHARQSNKKPRICGVFLIGAPRFELGTSPTRTVRATRLRHAPTRRQYLTRAPATRSPQLGIVARCPPPPREILAEIDRLLEPERFEDYCVNGLQVPGPEQVQTIATGVSAHAELFELAAGEGAQLLLVHHGLFWGSGVRAIDATLKRRLQHPVRRRHRARRLPPAAGRASGARQQRAARRARSAAASLRPFALHHGAADRLPREPARRRRAPPTELFARVQRDHRRASRSCSTPGPPRVRRLAIVSGAGADYTADAAGAGADALLTGEPAERSMAQAREAGVHLIAAGHYATETFGVRRLGEHLAERFELRHVFLDVPNPV